MGSGGEFAVSCEEESLFSGGNSEERGIIDILIEFSIESEYSKISGELAQVIVTNEFHIQKLIPGRGDSQENPAVPERFFS